MNKDVLHGQALRVFTHSHAHTRTKVGNVNVTLI